MAFQPALQYSLIYRFGQWVLAQKLRGLGEMETNGRGCRSWEDFASWEIMVGGFCTFIIVSFGVI
jgi:hypothetical protein